MKPVLFYVQSLFGSGHLNRISRIADCLSQNGYAVILISGGIDKPEPPDPSIHIIALPGIRSDASFTNLFDESGKRVTSGLFEKRAALIRQAVKRFRPAMIITEGFPFARRKFAQEVMTLIRETESVHGKAAPVVCSVRDVIQPKSKPDREQEILEIISDHYDRILIHGDQDFLPFETTFRSFSRIRDKAVYTGYLDVSHKTEQVGQAARASTVTVSAGGGVAGRQLYRTAIKTARTSAGARHLWHVLVGNTVTEADYCSWKRSAPANMRIERNRSDFRSLLNTSMVSVSQCGYNTAVDLISTRTPGIVVPYAGNGEMEQMIRASALEKTGHVRIVNEDVLNPASLIRAIHQWAQNTDMPPAPVSLSGNEKVLEFVRDTIGPAG